MFFQIIARRDQFEGFLVVYRFPDEQVQKLGPFKPPMTKELGVKGRDNDRFDVGDVRQVLDLFYPAGNEIARVMVDRSVSPTRHVRLLVNGAPRDPVVFDTSKLSVAVLWQKRTQIVKVEVKTDVSIEIPISRVPGMPFLGAPDLFAGFSVSPENRWAGLSKARSVDRVPRTR